MQLQNFLVGGLGMLAFILSWNWLKTLFTVPALVKAKNDWDAWLAQGPSLDVYRQANPQAVRGKMAGCKDCGSHKIAMIKRGHAYSFVRKNSLGIGYQCGPVDVYRAHTCAQCGSELWRTLGKGDPHTPA
jgi:hypothetical protein